MRGSNTKINFDIFLKTSKAHSYTYIVMGRTGCTGKTHMLNDLEARGFRAFELSEDIYPYISYDDKNHYIINDFNKTVIIILNESFNRPATNIRQRDNISFGFDNYDDMCDFINNMHHVLDTYGFVSIADACDLMGLNSDYIDNTAGWIDLSGIIKQKLFTGQWAITLPPAISI